MIDPTISRGRMRDLARPTPGAASPRPGADDLVASVIRRLQPDAFGQQPERLVPLELGAPQRLRGDDLRDERGGALDVAVLRVREHDRGRDVLVGQPGGTGGGRLLVGVGARLDPAAAPVAGRRALEPPQLGERLGMIVDPQIEDALVRRASSPVTTTRPAACRPRKSPPAASAASSAASRRSASDPRAAVNVSAIAGQTSSERSMLPWTLNPAPWRSPQSGMQLAPVCAAVRPPRSTKATCRTSRNSSSARSASSASRGGFPLCIDASPRWPYPRSVNDCVATAPTRAAPTRMRRRC